jgi:hypothetical protein
MTTPAPTAPTLSIATDQPVYQTGDTVTLTATYGLLTSRIGSF